MICKRIFKITFFTPSGAHFYTQLNDFNNCYITLMIQLNIYHLFADIEVVTSIAIQR